MDFKELQEKWKWRQKKVKYKKGKNSDKIFYVIRLNDSTAGLFAQVVWQLYSIRYAVSKGYIPVIDMKNYSNSYLEKKSILGTDNAWEYYFSQPMGYTLSDVDKSKNVIIGEECYTKFKDYHFKMIDKYFNLSLDHGMYKCMKKYIRLNTYTEQYIENIYQSLDLARYKVLGVLCRGSDYIRLRPPKHDIPPTVDEMIQKVREKINQWGCDRIFLATEDENYVDKFKEAFPNIVDTVQAKRYSYTGSKYLADIHFSREYDNYKKGLEYLSAIMILSRCNSFITSKTAGSLGVIRFNENKFEHLYIIDKGKYPDIIH